MRPQPGPGWGPKARLRPDRYRRGGTLQLFAVFEPRRGLGRGRCYGSKSSREFLDFLDRVLSWYPRGRIHLILDNLSAHKTPGVRRWRRQHPGRTRFHWLPTHSSWLNLIEPWFGVLDRVAYKNSDYRTRRQLAHGQYKGIRYLNRQAKPYHWKLT